MGASRFVAMGLLAAGLVGAPPLARAQPAGGVWRVGVLTPERPGALEALLAGLRELGYVEGRNVVLERRVAGKEDQFPGLAAELIRLDPHVVVAGTGRAALALKAVTTTVPIVMASSGDAVAQGLVASLARPGGNVTGFTVISPELTAKRLEILRAAVPRAVRIAVLGCAGADPVNEGQWAAARPAAQRLGVGLVPVFVRGPEQLAGAFEGALERRVDAVLVFDCSTLPPTEQVTALVNRGRVPALYPFPRYIEAGGLMSYGPDVTEQFRRAAVFVDKILRGARPADLPVEQPTRFELIVNLRTARALGLTIPPAVVSRADRIVE
jgi:putative ABC transport system substrate-binding protein